jgi:drug/metabolite transporter (DMT)-like permease
LLSSSRAKVIVVGFVQGALIGVHLLITKAMSSVSDPLLYTFSYVAIANLVLTLYLSMTHQWGQVKAAGSHWRRWVTVGCINVAIQVCTVMGVRLSGVANAGVLVRTDLIFGIILGYLFYKEKTQAMELLGGAVMLWGVWCVMSLSPTALIQSPVGNLFPLLAGALLAINGLQIKYGLAEVEGPVVAYLNTLVVTVVMLPIMAFTLNRQDLIQLANLKEIIGLALAGLTYAISLLAYYYVIKILPVWICRSFSLLSPIVAIAGGRFIFHEMLTLGQLWGAVLIMMGIGIVLACRALASRQRSVGYRRASQHT